VCSWSPFGWKAGFGQAKESKLDVPTCFVRHLSEQARNFGEEVPHWFGQLIRMINVDPQGRIQGINVASPA